LQIDADGQHDAPDIPKFLARARAKPGAVICGVPVYDESVPMGRLVGRYATHVWVWINSLSLEIRDSMCGFRVYPLAPVVRLFGAARPAHGLRPRGAGAPALARAEDREHPHARHVPAGRAVALPPGPGQLAH